LNKLPIISDPGTRVAMLVVNNGVDVRVIKEASSLKKLGYNVRIFGRANINDPTNDSLEAVPIDRVVPISDADTLWAYSRNTAMPLTFKNKLNLLIAYVVFTFSSYRLGGFNVKDIDFDIFSKTNSRLTRILNNPFRVVEWFVYKLTSRLSKTDETKPLGKIVRKIVRLLGDPVTIYIKNEYLLFAISMFDVAHRFAPNIVHSHDLYMLRTGSALKDKLNCKLVYDAHEFERDRVKAYPLWRKKLAWAEESRFISNANAVITVSDSIGKHMAKHYSIPMPTIIFNTTFVGEQILQECKNRYTALRQIIGLNANTPLIVHIGKLFDMHRQTGLFKQMIQSIGDLPDVHLALLGPNLPRSKTQVKQWAKRYFVEDRVHVIDPVPYQYVPSFINDATLGIVAMHGDNLNTEYAMPNKLFEMALAGIPIIVSDQLEIRNFVENHARGLVADCNDPQKIAQAIRTIADNPAKFDYSEEQLETIRKEFDWPAQAKKLKNLYFGLGKPVASKS